MHNGGNDRFGIPRSYSRFLRRWNLKHHQTSPDRLGNSFGPAGGAQFGKDGCDVSLNGMLRDIQPVRYQLVAEPFCEEVEHFQFAIAQRFGKLVRDRLLLRQKLRERRWHGDH